MNRVLDLPFKGDRQYLHSTDIFDGAMPGIRATVGTDTLYDIDFSFHSLVKRAVRLTDMRAPDAEKPVAACALTAGERRVKFYLYELASVPATRMLYDEASATQDFDVDIENAIGMSHGPSPLTDIETWVALTKALHERALPHIIGKWLCVRIKFASSGSVSCAGERKLSIVANLQNRLTRTRLQLNGAHVGEIHFAII